MRRSPQSSSRRSTGPTGSSRGSSRSSNFAILGHDLTQVDRELTPIMNVKRGIVYDKYADVFARLYAPRRGPDNEHTGGS